MSSSEFFEEQLEGSKIKSQIVASYFRKWAKIMLPRVKGKGDKIGYLDFFCGPGRYEDGSSSTPILILKSALENTELKKMLVTLFNDQEKANIEKLKKEIDELSGIDELNYEPIIMHDTIGEEIVKKLSEMDLIPSLIFIDPFGYKGLTLDLIASVIKDWGCDCIFFFNYNRINAAITNPFMNEHVNHLFGQETADFLRSEVKKLDAKKREELILKCFQEALKKVKGNYSISFKFYQEEINKTSHFIFFTSKHPLAYHLMKQTMADNCGTIGGVPSYEFNPNQKVISNQGKLFENDNFAIKDLASDLLAQYKGQTITRREIYEAHNIGKPYIESNYKEAILILEETNQVVINPPASSRRRIKGKLTLGEDIPITFL